MKPRGLTVVVGEHDFDYEEGTERRLSVAEVKVHPWYDSHTFDNDIGTCKGTVLQDKAVCS
jgi:hypothetical protein